MQIVMNPPYSGSLHLKILREAMKHSDDIVNLSPIRWLQDPLAEYKKSSDYKKFEDVRRRISSLDVISAKDAQSLFSAAIWTDLGVYSIGQNGGWNNKSLWKHGWFIDKVILKLKDNIANHLTDRGICNFSVPFIKISELYGHQGNKDFYYFMTTNIDIAKSKDASSCAHTVNFVTENEANNFFYSLQTKFYRFINVVLKNGMNVPWCYAPYLGDYTHPWTDDMLYEYFGLTDDEIKTIEDTL